MNIQNGIFIVHIMSTFLIIPSEIFFFMYKIQLTNIIKLSTWIPYKCKSKTFIKQVSIILIEVKE